MFALILSVMNICENVNILKREQVNGSADHFLPVTSLIMLAVNCGSCR